MERSRGGQAKIAGVGDDDGEGEDMRREGGEAGRSVAILDCDPNELIQLIKSTLS
jgi:hypothetical protein